MCHMHIRKAVRGELSDNADFWHKRFDAIKFAIQIYGFRDEGDWVAVFVLSQINRVVHEVRKPHCPLTTVDNIVCMGIAVVVQLS